jgi:hypothetical protein
VPRSRLGCDVANRTQAGGGRSLSFALSFGEIMWFDVRGEIQRCDSLKKS